MALLRGGGLFSALDANSAAPLHILADCCLKFLAAQGIQPGPGGDGLLDAASQVTERLACTASGGLCSVHTP